MKTKYITESDMALITQSEITLAHNEGYVAFSNRKSFFDNPYFGTKQHPISPLTKAWSDGWGKAQIEYFLTLDT